MSVSPAASAAFCDYYRLVTRHIGDYSARFLFTDNCASGHLDYEVGRRFAEAVFRAAVVTSLSHVFALEAKIYKGRAVVINQKDDISALASVTSVGSSCGNIFFSMERHAAVAAVARFNGYIYFIDEHFFAS